MKGFAVKIELKSFSGNNKRTGSSKGSSSYICRGVQ
jgi:hypothetical protein